MAADGGHPHVPFVQVFDWHQVAAWQLLPVRSGATQIEPLAQTARLPAIQRLAPQSSSLRHSVVQVLYGSSGVAPQTRSPTHWSSAVQGRPK
jgi:hypothetical protein